MYNPVTAGEKGGIFEMYHRIFTKTFHQKQHIRLQLPVKIVETIEQLPQQGFDSVWVNGGAQLLPVVSDNLLQFVWLSWLIN